jgi:hypothetical protein
MKSWLGDMLNNSAQLCCKAQTILGPGAGFKVARSLEPTWKHWCIAGPLIIIPEYREVAALAPDHDASTKNMAMVYSRTAARMAGT